MAWCTSRGWAWARLTATQGQPAGSACLPDTGDHATGAARPADRAVAVGDDSGEDRRRPAEERTTTECVESRSAWRRGIICARRG